MPPCAVTVATWPRLPKALRFFLLEVRRVRPERRSLASVDTFLVLLSVSRRSHISASGALRFFRQRSVPPRSLARPSPARIFDASATDARAVINHATASSRLFSLPSPASQAAENIVFGRHCGSCRSDARFFAFSLNQSFKNFIVLSQFIHTNSTASNFHLPARPYGAAAPSLFLARTAVRIGVLDEDRSLRGMSMKSALVFEQRDLSPSVGPSSAAASEYLSSINASAPIRLALDLPRAHRVHGDR